MHGLVFTRLITWSTNAPVSTGHGMLFARFLAENHLLIEPEMGVTITLNECEELAKEDGIDKWELAARFSHGMLPQVFRPDHPVFEAQLPANTG